MIYLLLLLYLTLTVVIEGLAVFALFSRKDYLYYSFLANLLTNPALNLLLSALITYLGVSYYYPVLLILEFTVVLVEAYVYRYLTELSWKHCLLLSLVLNGLSFLLGLVVNALWFN